MCSSPTPTRPPIEPNDWVGTAPASSTASSTQPIGSGELDPERRYFPRSRRSCRLAEGPAAQWTAPAARLVVLLLLLSLLFLFVLLLVAPIVVLLLVALLLVGGA